MIEACAAEGQQGMYGASGKPHSLGTMVGTMHSISALIASMAMPWAVSGANLPDVGVINGVGLKWNVISVDTMS